MIEDIVINGENRKIDYIVSEAHGYKWANIENMRCMPINEPQPEVQKWLAELPDRRLLLDIGANLGVYAVMQAKNYDKIIAFEPCPINYFLLKKSIELNDIRNVFLYPYAISNKNGNARLYQYTPGELTGGISINTLEETHPDVYFEVETRTLDSMDLTPSVIKINVEGAEYDILRGNPKTFTSTLPTTFVECHQWFEGGTMHSFDEGVDLVTRIMRIYGYTKCRSHHLPFRLIFEA